MRLTKSLKELQDEFCTKCGPDMKVSKTAEDLWKENDGKSINSTGADPDPAKRLNRMRADKLEAMSDHMMNLAVQASISNRGNDAKMLGDKSEELRRMSQFHRRMAEL